MNNVYHVSKKGSNFNCGNENEPFLTIQKAADVATMGDTIIVHEGVYREWVKPQNGGVSDQMRITYTTADGEKVVIKGSEEIKCWEKFEGTTWKAVLPNTFFGDFNPYTDNLKGDWFLFPTGDTNRTSFLHTGDVYLNEKSFYEAYSLDEVIKGEVRERGGMWNEVLRYPQDTIFKWFCEVNDESTTIYANFHQFNPNTECVEINVRRSCFYPVNQGLNYITVSGFEMSQAACPFTPPTADQPALLGVNWAKGWIIENNIIHDAKCSGISIGKEKSTGHLDCTLNQVIPGFQGQIESVFKALQKGWNKENIGSHIVRNNKIYDCGQNGIVGHMGCVFSEIYGNHIYNISSKREFFGHELGGIKLHAPIDVYIHDNCVHNTSLGLWLDWQTQGTRVSSNLFYDNARDLVVEVSHGPFLFDNNIFASVSNIGLLAQGGAFVNNLICGTIKTGEVLDRSTPYHFPHSTAVLGCSLVYSKDDRWYNNIFVGKDIKLESDIHFGTSGYDECFDNFEDYKNELLLAKNDDIEAFVKVPQPAYISSNAYFNGAKAYKNEKNNFISKENPQVNILSQNNEIYLEITLLQEFFNVKTQIQGTKTLGQVRIAQALFEDKNGNEIVIDSDINGSNRSEMPLCGPVELLKSGYNKIKIM